MDKDEVLALVRQYGEYDGEIVYNYATRFAAVKDTLTDDQTNTHMGRADYYERFPEYHANPNAYECSGAWIYSERLNDMPEIENTDFLFGITPESVIAEGAVITLIEDGFSYAEGPASDSSGNVFFLILLTIPDYAGFWGVISANSKNDI